MTINTTEDKVSSAGNGVTVDFPFPYLFSANGDLVVLLVTAATGAFVTQTLTTRYTVAGAGNPAGGTVTMIIPPATGETLVIYRDPPLTQAVDAVNGDPFDVDVTVESPVDKLTMIAQRQRTLQRNALRISDADTATDPDTLTLPIKTSRASKFLAFDANGAPIAAAGTSASLGPVSAFMNTLLDDADAATARATLGAGGAASGTDNTATGVNTLLVNTGPENTASGWSALAANTTGLGNTACGYLALNDNLAGAYNTANGYSALDTNTSGSYNVASGFWALKTNTTGSNNTASGGYALANNTTGSNNTASGVYALAYNTTGIYNTATGRSALTANTTGSGNVAIGPTSAAGNYAPVFNPTTENNRLCLGSTAVTNAYVQVNWTIVSDARDKRDFAEVPHGLEFVSQLKPTAFRFKLSRDDDTPNGPVRYGFLAQDVLELEGENSVIIDAEDAEKLRYNESSMIPVLVKAIQELKAEFDAYKLAHP